MGHASRHTGIRDEVADIGLQVETVEGSGEMQLQEHDSSLRALEVEQSDTLQVMRNLAANRTF